MGRVDEKMDGGWMEDGLKMDGRGMGDRWKVDGR